MALPADFSKIFGSTATGGLTPIGDVNYAKGWEFVGSNPPTKNDFSYLQNLSDLKSQWLYSNKLQRANPFGDIKSDGAAAVKKALENLGLGDESGYVGRLLNIQVFTSSGTYTPTAGTKRIKVKAVGGGGAGGGAVATSTGVSAGGGGGSGAYAEGYYTSGFSGLTVTIGAGGASASGAVGGNGGTTSFGALISCPGGGGGQIGTASNTTIAYSSQGAPGTTPTGSGLIVSGKGQPGQNGVAFGTAGIGIAGIGSPSPFGGGGTQSVNGNTGVPAISYGSGGGGTCNTPSQSAHSGGAGAPGVVIIEEYA